jgi:hypothetical protein
VLLVSERVWSVFAPGPEVGKLKQQAGDNLLVLGSPTLVRSLLGLGCWTS